MTADTSKLTLAKTINSTTSVNKILNDSSQIKVMSRENNSQSRNETFVPTFGDHTKSVQHLQENYNYRSVNPSGTL
jgi:hypothetical protein